MNEKVCRLCIQTICGNYGEIGDTQKRMLKLNMSISKENVMCNECMNNFQIFLNLKTACVDLKERESLLPERRNNVGSDPVNAENTNNIKSCNVPEDEIRCSFCMDLSAKESIISLHESKENMFLVDTLGNYIPELNLSNTGELLTCEICFDRIQSVSRFLNNCSYVEEEIHKYSEIEGMDGKGKRQIELQNLQQLIMKPMLKFEGGACHINQLRDDDHIQETYSMKAEDEVKCEVEEDGPESIHETEYVGIKAEQNDYDGFQKPTGNVKLDNNPLEIPLNKYEMCEYEAKDKGSFSMDMLNHKVPLEITKLKCGLCRAEVKCRRDLNKHMLFAHENSSDTALYKCKACAYETKYKHYLTSHKLIHKSPSEITMFKCDICTFETRHRRSHKVHMLVHKNPPDIMMFKCEMCSFQTKHKKNLTIHMLMHKSSSEIILFKCSLCTFETKHKFNLGKHMKKHKSPSEITMFTCGLCSYETRHKGGLKIHLSIAHKNPSEVTVYKCESCTYETKYKQNIAHHKLTHKKPSQITMFRCKICTFEAKRKSGITNHMLLHKSLSEITMFKCEMCTFKTKRKGTLRKHNILLHKSLSEITMFKCEICTFESKRKTNLKSHMLIHTNPSEITMFKCEMCTFKTKHKANLKGHMLIHANPSEITMFKCEMCSFETRHKVSVTRHMLTHKVLQS